MESIDLLLGILAVTGVLSLSGSNNGFSVLASNGEDSLLKEEDSINDRRKPIIVANGEDNDSHDPLPEDVVHGDGFTVKIPVLNEEDPLPEDVVHGDGFTVKIPVLNEEPEYNGTTDYEDDPKEYIEEPDFIEKNPSVLPDGTPLVEGDMLLTYEQLERFYSQGLNRKAIKPDAYSNSQFAWNARWPANSNGDVIINYRITSSSIRDTAIIKRALQHWVQHTCIRFQQNSRNGAFSHLFFNKGPGCFSRVGRVPMSNGNPGGQQISIGRGCETFGTIVHEVGHALGFFHEQSRSDRDDYVKIFFKNIFEKSKKNFKKQVNSKSHGVPYDYTSIMHYGDRYFSKNGRVTLSPIDPTLSSLLAQRTRLTFRDIKLANIIYNCIRMWRRRCGITTNPCKNEGYIGKNCKCVCRPRTSGTYCERVTGSYYPSLPCGGVVTTTRRITTPFFPRRHERINCVWLIRAPECQVPKVTITAFRAYIRSRGICKTEGLEVRTTSKYTGTTYCGKGTQYNPNNQDLKPGNMFLGTGRELLLNFYSRYVGTTGFSATVQFVQSSSCKTSTTTPTPPTPVPPTPYLCTLPIRVTSSGNCRLTRVGSSWFWRRHSRYSSRRPCVLRVQTQDCPKKIRIYVRSFRCSRSSKFCLFYTPLFPHASYRRHCSRNPTCEIATRSQVLVPTSSFLMSVYSRYWSLRISATSRSSPCHKRIILTSRSPIAMIRSRDARNDYNCEWFIQAPPGRRIRMTFSRWIFSGACYRALRSSGRTRRYWWRICRRSLLICWRNRGGLLVSYTGDVFYRNARPLCSGGTPGAITSARNKLTVSYQRILRYRTSSRIYRWWWYCGRSCKRNWYYVRSLPYMFEAIFMIV